MAKDDVIEVTGKVIEALPNGEFKVELENKHIVNADPDAAVSRIADRSDIDRNCPPPSDADN